MSDGNLDALWGCWRDDSGATIELAGVGVEFDGRLYAVWGSAADAPNIDLALLSLPEPGGDASLEELVVTAAGQVVHERSYTRHNPT